MRCDAVRKVGPVGGQLVCVTSPNVGRVILFPMEDPNEDKPVHRQACCAASFRCQGGNHDSVILKLFQVLKHYSLRKLHVHTIIFFTPVNSKDEKYVRRIFSQEYGPTCHQR